MPLPAWNPPQGSGAALKVVLPILEGAVAGLLGLARTPVIGASVSGAFVSGGKVSGAFVSGAFVSGGNVAGAIVSGARDSDV